MLLQRGILEVSKEDLEEIDGGSSGSSDRATASKWSTASTILGSIGPICFLNPYTAVIGVAAIVCSVIFGSKAGDYQNSAAEKDQEDADRKNAISKAEYDAKGLTPVF